MLIIVKLCDKTLFIIQFFFLIQIMVEKQIGLEMAFAMILITINFVVMMMETVAGQKSRKTFVLSANANVSGNNKKDIKTQNIIFNLDLLF